MRRKTLHAAALAALIVLAGCTGGLSGTATPASDGASTPASDETSTSATDASSADAGTVRFYVSDQPAAIEDFRHLNVTVSRVGFQRADGGGNGSDAGWVEYEVDDRTVDLTRLRGDNATLVGEFPVRNGTYTKVFAYVSEVNATLEGGERVNVKLPSEKLQIDQRFEVTPNESVDFVFDIAVHKAGNSGKYILRPVISESGTDVPIEEVDGEDDEREDDGDDGDEADEDDIELNASFVGNVTPGSNATVEVTRNGSPVANATVVANDDEVGTTDGAGRITFAVPADAEELEVEIVAGEAEAELKVEFEEPDGERESDDDGDEAGGREDDEAGEPDDGEA